MGETNNNGFNGLRYALNNPDSKIGGKIESVLFGVIVLSMIFDVTETLTSLPENFREILEVVNVGIIVVFCVEYFVRVWAAYSRLNYIFSFYGIIDLVAWLPYAIGGVDLRGFRAFRLLRIVKILKFGKRYAAGINRLANAFGLIKTELAFSFYVVAIVFYIAATGIYYFEHEAQPEAFGSIPDALWWALITLTTVGYGDIYPITTGGRLFTAIVLMAGLALVAVPAGLMASAMSAAREKENKSEDENKKELRSRR